MFWKKKEETRKFVYDVNDGSTYEDVSSQGLADEAVAAGRLIRAYIIDPIFGGMEEKINTLPVPPAAQKYFDHITDVMADAIRAGKEVDLDVKPEYRGDSSVPFRVTYNAGAAGIHTINIW